MLADEPECEWLLKRLCESLDRYMYMTKDVERQRVLREGKKDDDDDADADDGDEKEGKDKEEQEGDIHKVKKRKTK